MKRDEDRKFKIRFGRMLLDTMSSVNDANSFLCFPSAWGIK
jgi:hypothetical protein